MNKITLSIIIGLLFVSVSVFADISGGGGGIGPGQYIYLNNTGILPVDSTWDLGEASNRWANGYFANLDTNTIVVNTSVSGNINMGGYALYNAGYIQAGYFTATSTLGTASSTMTTALGIASTTPYALLSITGNGTTPYLNIASSTATALYVGADGKVGIGTQAPGTAGLAIMNGNVGIGTTTPLTTLDTYGNVSITGATPNELRFYQGTNYVGFEASSSLAASKIWTLPVADGSASQVLTTYGDGVLYWSTPSGGGGLGTTTPFTSGYIPFTTSTLTLTDSMLYQSANKIGIGTTTLTSLLTLRANSVTSTNFSLIVVNSSSTEITRIRDDGYVKIGQSADTTIRNILDVAGNTNFDSVAAPVDGSFAAALAGAGAGNVDNGIHYYQVAYYTADGGTTGSYTTPTVNVTVVDKTTNGQVLLTGIPVSPDPRVVGRRLYRSKVGESKFFTYRLATIGNNSTTTYTDNTADASLNTNDYIYRKANTTAGLYYLDGSLMMGVTDVFHTSLGIQAGQANTRGDSWVAIGGQAMYSNTTGYGNVAVGYTALYDNTTGAGNIGIGYDAIRYNREGNSNVAIGSSVLSNTAFVNFSNNVAIGDSALRYASSSNNNNVGIGFSAGRYLQGTNNVFVGAYNGDVGATVVGATGNTYIGYDTGGASGTSSDYNILLGYNIDLASSTNDYQMSIGNLIFGTSVNGTGKAMSTGNVGIGTSSPFSLLTIQGTTSTTQPFRIASSTSQTLLVVDTSGNLGIGTSTPNSVLDVNGSVKFETLTSCALGIISDANGNLSCSVSDERLKNKIRDMGSVTDKVAELHPVTFEWIDQAKGKGVKYGLIAQEVEKVFPELVSEFSVNGETYKQVDYNGLSAILVKAFQEKQGITPSRNETSYLPLLGLLGLFGFIPLLKRRK